MASSPAPMVLYVGAPLMMSPSLPVNLLSTTAEYDVAPTDAAATVSGSGTNLPRHAFAGTSVAVPLSFTLSPVSGRLVGPGPCTISANDALSLYFDGLSKVTLSHVMRSGRA